MNKYMNRDECAFINGFTDYRYETGGITGER